MQEIPTAQLSKRTLTDADLSNVGLSPFAPTPTILGSSPAYVTSTPQHSHLAPHNSTLVGSSVPEASSAASTPSKKKQQRIGISNAERAALRRHKQENGAIKQNDLKIWFEQKFGRRISQGCVSESLSSKFDNVEEMRPSCQRRDRVAWPELEKALARWVQLHQLKSTITDEAIRAQAQTLWHELPNYAGIEMPTFSSGWIWRFRTRNDIKRANANGKPADVPEDMTPLTMSTPLPPVMIDTAIDAVHTLLRFESQQLELNNIAMATFEAYEKSLQQRQQRLLAEQQQMHQLQSHHHHHHHHHHQTHLHHH